MNQRRYKPTLDRAQSLLLPERVEDYVGENHQVRALDAYVDTLDLASLGFKHTESGTVAGQPPYNPWAMLKLYLYGYQHGIRSSRKLEAETRRNLEVIWLVKGMRPSYKSIADFRKDHVAQLREVNRDFVLLCRELSLFGGDEVAVDGSFFSADASRGSIQTEGCVDKELERIEKKIEEYHRVLEDADAADEKSRKQDVGNDEVLREKIEKLKRRQEEKRELKSRMERSGDTQVSVVDEDARLLRKHERSVVGYNAQIVVDSKHKMIVAQDVVQDGNDAYQLFPMLGMAKESLGVEKLTGLGDVGYYDGWGFKDCKDNDIEVYVPIRDTMSEAMKKRGRYDKGDFKYDAESDSYFCPAGKQLRRRRKPCVQNGKRYIQYAGGAEDCGVCVLRGSCLSEKTKYKRLLRWEHEEVIDRHRQRMKGCGEKMKKREAMVEYVFGTLRYRNGLHQFLMRGLEKCRGEFGLMTLAYNLTRALKIVGVRGFVEYCVLRRAHSCQMA